jgi:hypothetical protein
MLINCEKLKLRNLPPHEIWENFIKNGFLLFQNGSYTADDFVDFTSLFIKKQANDAMRRSGPKVSKAVAGGVDGDSHEIWFHSESSFSPAWPKVIWLYCQSPGSKDSGGQTKIVDGQKIWTSLSRTSKNFFQSHLINFHCEIPVMPPKENGRDIPWEFPELGIYNGILRLGSGMFEYHLNRFCVAKAGNGKIAFANHFLHSPREEQMIEMKIAGADNLPSEIQQEMNSALDNHAVSVEWQAGDFVMLDNRRFMHARAEYVGEQKRVMKIAQALEVKDEFNASAMW